MKIVLNKNGISNIEFYTLEQVVEMIKVLAEQNAPKDRIRISLTQSGISVKS